MFTLGAIKDKPDSRDYTFRDTRIAKAAGISFPDKVYWFPFAPIVKSQQPLSSCVACACYSLREFVTKSLSLGGLVQYGALFGYFKGRQIMGSYPEDSGLTIRDCLKGLQDYGLPDETTWPYAPGRFNEEPLPEVYENALWKRIYTYHRLDTMTLSEMKQCLVQKHAFVLSVQVFGNLIVFPISQGQILMPQPGDPPAGGHCILVLGYDDNYKAFYCQNSWGPDWGLSGRFYLPYEYVANYAWDAWTVVG